VLDELAITFGGVGGQLKRPALERRQREEQQRYVGVVQRIEPAVKLAQVVLRGRLKAQTST